MRRLDSLRYLLTPRFSIATDKIIGGAVVIQLRIRFAFQLRNNSLGKHLTQLNSPLIKRIHAPYCPLRKNTMLIERNQLAESLRSDALRENHIRWSVPLEHPVWYEPIRRSLGFHLFCSFAKR